MPEAQAGVGLSAGQLFVDLVTAAMKLPAPDLASVRAFLVSDKLKLDGSKGVTPNYRPWDGQMRQPILLSNQ